jgi:hypothetical protein
VFGAVSMKPSYYKLKAEEFRKRAARCRELLTTTEHPKAIADLEEAAEGWAGLAETHDQLDAELSQQSRLSNWSRPVLLEAKSRLSKFFKTPSAFGVWNSPDSQEGIEHHVIKGKGLLQAPGE